MPQQQPPSAARTSALRRRTLIGRPQPMPQQQPPVRAPPRFHMCASRTTPTRVIAGATGQVRGSFCMAASVPVGVLVVDDQLVFRQVAHEVIDATKNFEL